MKFIKLTIYLSAFFLTANVAHGAAITWDGGGSTNNWSEAVNWSGNVVPGLADDVTFDATSVKDATWDASGPAIIKSLTVNATYSGTFSLGRNVQIGSNTSGASWTFSGANFNAGTYKVTYYPYSGTFTAGTVSYYDLELKAQQGIAVSGTATVANDFTNSGEITSGTINVSRNASCNTSVSSRGGAATVNLVGTGDQTISSSGNCGLPNITVNKTSGSVVLGSDVNIGNYGNTTAGNGYWTWTQGSSLNAGSYTLTLRGGTPYFLPGSVTYYNVSIIGSTSGSGTLAGNGTISGNFYLGSVIYGSSYTLNVGGNLTFGNYNYGPDFSININGSGGQTISSSGGALPNISVNKSGGTLIFGSNLLAGGTSGSAAGNWIWTSGQLNPGSYTLTLYGPSSSTFTPGNVTYYNVTTQKYGSGVTLTLGGNLKVSNNLTIADGAYTYTFTTSASNYSIITKNFSQAAETFTLNSSVFKVSGNFSRTGGTFNYNTSTVALIGFNQTISGSSTFYRLYKLINQPDAVTFTAGTTTTIATGGVMRFWGKAEGKTLAMRSSVSGSPYTITKTGSAELEYVDIKDASFSAAVTATASNDSGGNTNVTVTKEFISKIRSSGGDYTTLSAWEAAVQANLTAAATKVFSHSGITGAIPDNSAVTGATSGATGTAVHVTGNQILIKSIVGTFQSGEQIYLTQNVNYVVASDAGYGAIATAECYAMADTTAVVVDGWTTDNTRYINIYTPASERHDGKWNTSKYYLEASTTGEVLVIVSSFVRIAGLQVRNTGTGKGVSVYAYDTNGWVGIDSCIVRISSETSYSVLSSMGSATNVLNVFNSISYGGSTGLYDNGTGTINAYGCMLRGSSYGMRRGSATVTAKNCYAATVSGSAYQGTITKTTSASSDTTGSSGLQNIGYSTANFTNVTAGSEDLHITNKSALRDYGTDLSVDATFPVIDDIDGETRPLDGPPTGGWDIGADEASGFEKVGAVSGGSVKINASQTGKLTNGLVLMQSFDGPHMDWSQATAEARDQSGQGNHGDAVNMTQASVSPGKIGQALDFNGWTDPRSYISFSIISPPAAPYSVSFWFKPRELGRGQTVVSLRGSNTYPKFVFKSNNKLVAFGGGEKYRYGTRSFSSGDLNQWWHAAFVVADSSALTDWKVYLNGADDTGVAGANTGTYYNPSSPGSIGDSAASSENFNGLIDEVRVYNRALSADEISTLYNMGKVRLLGN